MELNYSQYEEIWQKRLKKKSPKQILGFIRRNGIMDKVQYLEYLFDWGYTNINPRTGFLTLIKKYKEDTIDIIIEVMWDATP